MLKAYYSRDGHLYIQLRSLVIDNFPRVCLIAVNCFLDAAHKISKLQV
jgi:hypothetical protein